MNIYYYIKIWAVALIIVTFVYFLFLYFIKNHNTESFEINELSRLQLKTLTPAHPPPLFNFTDSPNVLRKFTPVNKLI